MIRWRNPQTGRLEPLSHSDVMRALRAQRRKPTEHDAPPIKPFPGRKPTIHEGQLTLTAEDRLYGDRVAHTTKDDR